MAQAEKTEQLPPTQGELGRAEEERRAVEAKLRQCRLARRRLAELDGTLFWSVSQHIDAALRGWEEHLRWLLAE